MGNPSGFPGGVQAKSVSTGKLRRARPGPPREGPGAMRRPVRVMDAGRSATARPFRSSPAVPDGPSARKSPMVVVEPDSTVSHLRGSVMFRPFSEAVRE